MHISRSLKVFINYVAGPLLFIFIGISIYRQVQAQPNLDAQLKSIVASINGPKWWMLPASIFLMFANWGLESVKWQKLASHVKPISFWNAFRSVIAGVSFTMLTPNRMGEFLGRALYFPDGSRVRAATLTLVGSLSQLIVTFITGIAGLVYLKFFLAHQAPGTHEFSVFLLNVLLYGTAMLIIIGLLLYFNIAWVIKALEKIPPISKYAYFIHLIGELKPLELIKILLLSAMRFMVFLMQYLLLFGFFGVSVSAGQLIAGTCVLFLMLAAIPTIALAELGIRGKASIFVYGLFTTNVLGILATTASIWFINIIFPALAGSLLLLGIKLFKKS